MWSVSKLKHTKPNYMKKLLTLVLLFVTCVVMAQDSTATAPAASGFNIWDWLTPRTISEILTLTGVTGWLMYRLGKVRDALNTVIAAAEDGSVSEQEFQDIVKSVKAIWGKKA